MITVKINHKKVAAALRRNSRVLQKQLRVHMKQAGEAFVGDIVSHQMTGRPGLRRRTGHLIKSWFQRVAGTLGTDMVLTVATRSKYAKPHELGKAQIRGHGVKAHFRRTRAGYTKTGRKRRFKTIGAGLKSGGLVRVRMHTRKPHTKIFPVRLHIRSRWRSRGLRLFTRGVLRAYREFSNVG
jgi:hypothetical protein